MRGSSDGEGCAAQLLHLAQRTTWSPSVGFRRLAGLVISIPTKRLSVFDYDAQTRKIRKFIAHRSIRIKGVENSSVLIRER
jgi:hypothetical protein